MLARNIRLSCNLCQENIVPASVKVLWSHVTQHHINYGEFSCPFCWEQRSSGITNLTFRSKAAFVRHFKKSHSTHLIKAVDPTGETTYIALSIIFFYDLR